MNCHYVIIAGLAADRLCQSASIRNEVNRTAAAYLVTTPAKLYLPIDLDFPTNQDCHTCLKEVLTAVEFAHVCAFARRKAPDLLLASLSFISLELNWVFCDLDWKASSRHL